MVIYIPDSKISFCQLDINHGIANFDYSSNISHFKILAILFSDKIHGLIYSIFVSLKIFFWIVASNVLFK